jgi:putative peptidoglycan lipid II flippase
MALGVWAVATVQGVTRMFYAYGDTRTPVLCSALNLVCFVGMSLLGMRALGHAAIALANSAASCAQLALLLVLLRRRLGPLGLPEVLRGAGRALLASLAMVFVASDLCALGDFSRGGNDPINLAVYALALGFGLLVYLAASYLLGSRELGQLTALALRRRTAS